MGLAGRALMFAVSSTVVVCAHIGDWVTRGHPAPRRFLDAVEFLHNRPKYYGSAYHESGVERDLCFIKQLREAKGPKVVGVFGAAHMSGVINLWNEYAGAPFDVWQTTTDGGKDFSREVYKRCRRTVDEWDWREVRRKRGEIVQRALAPLGVDVDLQAWAERRERWAKARRLRYIRSQQKT